MTRIFLPGWEISLSIDCEPLRDSASHLCQAISCARVTSVLFSSESTFHKLHSEVHFQTKISILKAYLHPKMLCGT